MHTSKYATNRRYKLDAGYFSTIDTEAKAYWLGFLWADGNISQTTPRSSGPNRLRLVQKDSEKKHIEDFLEAIAANYPVVPVKRGHHVLWQIDINSRPLCASLQDLGYGLKTERTSVPRMPRELVRHFIRGYFDGDGCLSIYTQQIKQWSIQKQEWSLTGSPILLTEMRIILEEDAGITVGRKLKTYAKSDIAVSLRYGKASDVEALHKYLYDEAEVFMQSKHNTFVEYFSRVK